MQLLVSHAAAICAALAAWLVRGALALQSSAPDAPKVGLLPPWWELLLFVLAGVCVVLLLRPAADRMLPLFATGLCIVPWLPGVRSPALLVWAGPLGVAVWVGAAVAAVWAGSTAWRAQVDRVVAPLVRNPRRAPVAAAFLAFGFFSAVAFGARDAVPSGDEPHYLIITQSLLNDGDLQIENNHAGREYEAYFPGTLQPDFWRRGQNGAIYSVHAPGLPALVAPAFLVGGYRGVVLFLVLLASAGAALLWRLAHATSGSVAAAWLGLAATVVATPVAFHAFTISPDGPAGVIVLTGFWALLRVARISPDIPAGSRRAWVLHGLALALLPWMHVRLAVLSGGLALAILLRLPRDRSGVTVAAAFLSLPVLSAIAWFGFFYVVYGTPSPAAPWTRLVTSWSFVPGSVGGLLFDQQFGVLPYAPIVLAGAAGWVALFRVRRRLAIEIAAAAAAYILVTTRLWIWWGGWSVPARFWVPLFWLGGVTAALAWRAARARSTRGTLLGALLVSAYTSLGLAYTFGGRLAYNVRDGYAQWFDWISPLADLPLGLPSFFRSIGHLGAYGQQVLIGVALFLAAFLAVRRLDDRIRGTGAVALALLLAYALAGMAFVSLQWRTNGSTPLRASQAQLRMLEAARAPYRLGVSYGAPPRVGSSEAVLRDLRIASSPRLAAAPGSPPLVLPGWFPAGTYVVEADIIDGSSGEYEVRVLRAGAPIRQGAAGGGGTLRFRVNLPADTPAFILRGGGLRNAVLRPEHVTTGQERGPIERAASARRYGSTIAWFTGANAFDDPDGIWTGGRTTARLLFQPDRGTSIRLAVRNGPLANQVSMHAQGGWSWMKTLNPGQEAEVEIPLDAARGTAAVDVSSRAGFRPSDVDPGSRDTRLLGVWLSPR